MSSEGTYAAPLFTEISSFATDKDLLTLKGANRPCRLIKVVGAGGGKLELVPDGNKGTTEKLTGLTDGEYLAEASHRR